MIQVPEQQQKRRSTLTLVGQIYRTLLQALAVLYQRTGQYPEALRILLKGGSIVGSPLTGSGASNIGATNYVFDIIQKRNLYASMVNEVEYLLEFDKLVADDDEKHYYIQYHQKQAGTGPSRCHIQG